MATFSHRSGGRASATIFAKSNFSPRQIANKTISLGCKKLDRDDKRSKPHYHLLERLLIYNTINKAEEVLNKRTRRTNRRVMAAEEDEDLFNQNSQRKQHIHHQPHAEEYHSPLCSHADDDDNDDASSESTKADSDDNYRIAEKMLMPSPTLEAKSTSELSPDCRPVLPKQAITTSPIAAI